MEVRRKTSFCQESDSVLVQYTQYTELQLLKITFFPQTKAGSDSFSHPAVVYKLPDIVHFTV